MKYITLPIHLFKFWYIESIEVFFRTWKNLILFLEEDLAVGLMWKLLFVPLFHDATIVGRILSFLFRTVRLFIGIFAYVLATTVLAIIAIYWFYLPPAAILGFPGFGAVVTFTGVGLFLIHTFTHPHKKVWQVSKENLFEASLIKKKDLDFLSLLKAGEVNSLLINLELKPEHFPDFKIANVDAVSIKALELAKQRSSQYLSSVHFFVAALGEIPDIDKTLLKFDLKLEDFDSVLSYLEQKKNKWRRVYIWDDDFAVHHLKGVNRGWLGVPTPSLDLIGEDLTREAARVGYADFIRGSGVVEEIINILSQETGRNVIIVGPAGSGKSALIRNLAKKVVAGDAPSALATKRLVLLDLTKLLSGIKTQGELAERIKNIFEEVGYAQNVIVVVEEIADLGLGEAGATFNLYSLMQPYLESDAFQFIGTTETENYSKIIEKNGAFARLFRKVELPPASFGDSLKILIDRSIVLERKHKVRITYLALKEAVELSSKLIHDRVLPDCAISVLKEAQTRAVDSWVTKKVVREVVSQRSKIPVIEVGELDKGKLLNLEDEIHRKLIDQSQAVKAVCDSLRRSATGMREETRPIGSFLFVGPTGVGKTELAKTLSLVYFKNEGAFTASAGSSFIRFDMSEYQSAESVNRLIGSSGEGGQLTEAIRNNPYCLLLLDEFEKADPKILTLFLQVLDDGRLTDGMGRTVDFTNTIIIATSNAGSLLIAQGLGSGKSMDDIDKEVNDELLRTFKPELINRFDDVVLFKLLSQDDLQKIVTIKLTTLQNQMKEKGYILEFDAYLVVELAKRGFDPVLGARPLRRLIQDSLEANLSRLILENKLVKGNTFKAGVDLL
ncbi:MAG: AAA family ATPase [Patescibacteria group bacterium]